MRGSLSSRRAWIEIMDMTTDSESGSGRSPHGERGLKLPVWGYEGERMESLSSRRAWIEIRIRGGSVRVSESLSSRRAWIEIKWQCLMYGGCRVALLTESVD